MTRQRLRVTRVDERIAWAAILVVVLVICLGVGAGMGR